ncbi:MAG TPA: ligase-associated DNA damage response endonuclease PdeM [Xanthobacteraceae bacterium]|nr:ligase-associated DNA damage response endonuclease PdeM [Xanthobacteraceae bacterium]
MEIELVGARLAADPSGALWWPEEKILVVADLHFEKGSHFALAGQLLPPYDTAATLARLAQAIARYAPKTVIALGDSFHDGEGPGRLAAEDRAQLAALQRGRDWIWIAGNHDPEVNGVGGSTFAMLAVGPITLRHEPQPADEAEIAGHLHPVARVRARGSSVRRRCFVSDGRRMVMPAFGAFTGGLNVRHPAFDLVFKARAFAAHMLGNDRLYSFPGARCLADEAA